MSSPVAPRAGVDLRADRVGEVLAASIVLLILPTAAVILRLLSRWISGAKLWWDDYTVILAMILAWGPNISNIDSTNRSLGKHYAAIANPLAPLVPLVQFFKSMYAFVILYVLAMTAAKFSIIFFMYRIFPVVHFRRFLLACHAIVGSFGLASILVQIFPCQPIHAFWDTIAGKFGGHCINTIQFFMATGSLNTAINFVLLALPIPLVWNLRTSVLQKAVLTIIFILGLTVCAVGLTYVLMLSNLDEEEVTWNYVDAAIWCAAEPSTAVVCACLPSFRPLLARLIWGRAYRPTHLSNSTQRSFSKSWLSGGNNVASEHLNGIFNQLRESEGSGYGMQRPWMHRAAVSGGVHGEDSDEYAMSRGVRKSHYDSPKEGIQVQTTITVTERVHWQDDLF